MGTDNHAKGQKDRAKGSYNPPTSTWGDVVSDGILGTDNVGKNREAREQYREGWKNADRNRPKR